MHPGTDFLEMKRLYDVIVRAGTEPVDLVLPAVAGGEDQDRVGLALVAGLPDDVEPRNLRQAQVDDREVNRIFEREVKTLASVGRLLHRVARLSQLRRK